MPSKHPGVVTPLLAQVRAGNEHARHQLGELVYAELRRIAAGFLRRQRPDPLLQPTALVHEAFLRLLREDTLRKASNRAYFFAAAARAMRQVLVDHARERATRKRGGGRQRVRLDDVLDLFEKPSLDVLRLHDALDELATLHGRQSQIVELRFFGGYTVAEVAGLLDVSVSLVEKDFRQARAFLRGRLTEAK